MQKSKFLKITCPRCKAPIIVYSMASTKVKCPACNYLLLKNQGGKAKIRAPVKKVL